MSRDAPSSVGIDEHVEATLADLSPDAIIVVRDGTIVFLNAKAEVMFGYSREELLGSSVEVLVPESLRELHRDYRRSWEAEPKERPMGTPIQLLARRKDGTTFPADIALRVVPSRDCSVSVACIVRNLTEHRRLMQRLERLRDPEADAGALSRPDPAVFDELVEQYGEVLDDLLAQRTSSVDRPVSVKLKALAERLANCDANSRDVLRMHVAAVKARSDNPKLRPLYTEEARFALIELMGRLVNLYQGPTREGS